VQPENSTGNTSPAQAWQNIATRPCLHPICLLAYKHIENMAQDSCSTWSHVMTSAGSFMHHQALEDPFPQAACCNIKLISLAVKHHIIAMPPQLTINFKLSKEQAA